MIKSLLINHIRDNVPDNEVAVLLSGGVDSISVGLAAHHAGKKIHAYSFQLGKQTSYDFAKAAVKSSSAVTERILNLKAGAKPSGDTVSSNFIKLFFVRVF